MSLNFYIPRKISSNDKIYSEAELLAASNYAVVLAEPGGGKTELMVSLAKQLGTTAITANKFVHMGAELKNIPLVIDAFDELAKVDNKGIYQLLSQAKKTTPTHFYLSSRSSEWDSAATYAFNDFFEQPPLVVRLFDFNEAEQRAIFDHHVPNEDFTAFQAEVARFDLKNLLPNPQFLKLFADAYIESRRRFTDKRSIFAQAVERLAKETNPYATRSRQALSSGQKIGLASEVFTKLLLSGAEGVCLSEVAENRIYPFLPSLFVRDNAAEAILSTRLFKPGDSADQHRWVHKIVAEYCAANYLINRIANPADPLTLPKCLPIIAPNSIVRDELRGLLGWMAALGNKPIEESAIRLDPYAVLANGDPSQLEDSSKRLLIHRLKNLENDDPYFRRGDSWRRFSVVGFFTPDILEEIKPLVIDGNNGHLRDLLLELLVESPAIEHMIFELRQLVLSREESTNSRLLASNCLLAINSYDHRADLDALTSEASNTSLRLVAQTFETLGLNSFARPYLANFFRACAVLYPDHQKRHDHIIGGNYFIRKITSTLDIDTTEWLLNVLTNDITCICKKNIYECYCRNGISKIIGLLLDQYFSLATPPFNPLQVWRWIENLNFHARKGSDQSKAVQILQENDCLRKDIIAHVFGKMTDRDQIFQTKIHKFSAYNAHSGLNFKNSDYKFIVDLAFENNNPKLWASFIARHQFYRDKDQRGPDDLRRHMREQALRKPELMKEWANDNKSIATQLKRDQRLLRYSRNMKLRSKKQSEINAKNIRYVQDNRELIGSGRHFNCLIRFAYLVLMSPEKIEQEFGDETLVRNALRNCIDYISPHVPDLLNLAELHCSLKNTHSEIILYAACVEIMRAGENLEGVDLRLLEALRTNLNTGFNAVSAEERDILRLEVDRLIFPNRESTEHFLRRYLEPQLAHSECKHPALRLLRDDEAFSQIRSYLSLEWLHHFHELPLDPLNTLFDIAAQYGNRDDLKKIIAEHCAEFMTAWPKLSDNQDIEQKRIFWLIRAWYFLDDTPKTYWDWIKADKRNIFILNNFSGKIGHSDYSYWPRLKSCKVEEILDAFIEQWPKVPLPSNYGTSSPPEEKAYRFLTEVIWSLNSDEPEEAIPVLRRLIDDPRFADLNNILKSIHADQAKKKALMNFEPPSPQEIVKRLDCDEVVTVEGLRQLLIQELLDFQQDIYGGEFNSVDRFYAKGERLDEVRSTEIIAERLNLRLQPQGITVTPEHQLKDAKRSDFTATKLLGGKRRLLVTEVKGQWHTELYTAASEQLHKRYSIHPDAEQQGIYLAIWFGENEMVAGRKLHEIKNAPELKKSIETTLPPELVGLIDIFVLDVSNIH